MDLRDYLTTHDGRVHSHGPELVRLANEAGCAPSYLYLAALGHKRPSDRLARALAEASLEQALTVEAIKPPTQPASLPPEVSQ